MKITFAFYLSFVFILFSSCADRENPIDSENDPHPDGSELSGSLNGFLTKKNSPYYVVQDIFVDSANSLVVEPGVSILFYDSTKLVIRGSIYAAGSISSIITFTSHANSWFGIDIENSNQNNLFQFCTINKVIISDNSISEYGALTIHKSSATVINCFFKDNYTMNGGGLSIIESDVSILNNIFVYNQAVSFGGAILSIESTSKIYNNTIYRNNSFNYGGGLVLIDPVFDDVQNNIFYLNSNQTGDPRISVYSGDSANYNTQYNFLWYSNLNPEFISNDNLHLKTGSPCINQGNPNSEFNDWDGSRNDQGAYGGPDGNW